MRGLIDAWSVRRLLTDHYVAIPPQSSERGREPPQGGFAFSWSLGIRTNIYVDGFNLYYGAVKGTPYRWLDVAKLCLEVLPDISINRIRYFTALVKSTPADPHMANRQQFFIRALETIPNLTVHYGHFLESKPRMPLAYPPFGGPATVEVVKMEEKGSDVNIATYMLVDAFRSDCDQLIVVTNDSDLAEPVRIINKELNIPVGVFNPHSQSMSDCRHRISGRLGPAQQKRQSVTLRKVAKFSRDIKEAHLIAAQFPAVLTDAQGKTVRKPAGW